MYSDYTPAEIEAIQRFINDMDAYATRIQRAAHGNPADNQTAREIFNAAEVAENFLDTHC